MASATEYSMLFKLGAQLGKEFNSTFSSAQKTLSETQKQIVALNKQQGDITAYGKQQQAVEATNRKLSDLQKEYDNIQREIQETEGYSSALENKLIEKQRAIDKTSGSLQQQTEKLGEMRSALQDAGIDTDHLADESAKLAEQIDNLSDEQAEAAKSADEYGESGVSAFEAVGSALVAAGVLAGLKSLAEEYAECVTGAAAFADEIGTVSVQYGIAADDLQAYYYAAELVDVSSDTLTKSMAKQIKSMKAVQDGTKLSEEAYEKLGVSVLNADGTLRNSDDVYWEVIDALGNMSNETERDSIAQQILGRSAMELNTLIKAGSGVLKDYAAEAKAAGYVMSEDMLAACMAMDDEMQRSKSGTLALKNAVGSAFAPEITSATKLWNQFLAGLTEFTQDNPIVVKSIIALAAEAGLLLGVYTGYVAIKKTMNTVRALSTVLKAKETVATAAGTAATTAQATATTAATAAQTGLNTAMAMNPIGLILTGIAALTVGIIALVESTKSETTAMEELTATAQDQRDQISELNDEYDEVCDAYGEASYEAQSLKWEIDDLNAAFEGNQRTLQEYVDDMNAAFDAAQQLSDEYYDTVDSIQLHEKSTDSLITRLFQLASQSQITTAAESEMKAIIDKLNESVKGLSITYDDVISKGTDLEASIRSIAQAQAYKDIFSESSKAYVDAYEQEIILANKKKIAEEELAAATQRAADAELAYDRSWRYKTGEYAVSDAKAFYNQYWGAEKKAFDNAKAALAEYQSTYDSAVSAYNDNQKLLDEAMDNIELYSSYVNGQSNSATDAETANAKALQKALRAVRSGFLDTTKAAKYYGISSTVLQEAVDSAQSYQESLTAAIEAVNKSWYSAEEAAEIYGVTANDIKVASGIQNTIDKIQELSDNYREVRDAAEQSIKGQYDLWDTAAVVIAKSIGDINTALETQLSYWSDYNTDLASLLERTDDVEGLSDVIASFADGSEDSVNAIAGMASASDEDLKTMVSNWKKVQEQQESASESIAEIVTGYGEQIGELQSDLEDAVDGLNLDTEATSAAKATVDAYTQAIKDGTGEAVKAAETLAALVAAALQNAGISVDVSGGTVGGSTTGAWKSYEDAASAGYSNIRTKSEFARSNNADKQQYGTYEAYLDAMFKKYMGTGTSESSSKNAYSDPYFVGPITPQMALQDGMSYATAKARGLASGYTSSEWSARRNKNMPAYATGTNSAAPGVALVGEEGPELVTFGGGEKVYTAKETQEFIRYMHDGTIINAYADGTGEALQIITILPLIQSYMEAMRSYRNEAQSEPVSAERIPEQRITITVSPNFTIEGNSTDGLEDRLRDFAEEIKQEVMDAIEDAGIDAKRGAYV